MLVLAVILREVAFWADSLIHNDVALSLWWLHSGSGDDARNLVSTLVGALITMASVMFSITMVVLSLAAAQFGSRLVRTYMADFKTQLSLGIFVMTIVYCLLVLRTVYKDLPAEEVPHVAVTLSLLLGLLCVLTLLLFMHAIARSMVADDVIRRVAAELEQELNRLPPLKHRPRPRSPAKLAHEGAPRILRSVNEGYVQAVDYGRLCELASDGGMKIRVLVKAGGFMCREGWLAEVSPASALDAEVEEAIQSAVEIGARRTPTQDIEFLIRYLVDVALRALSPGINDPRTATVVIDHLRGSLSHLMRKEIKPTARFDSQHTLRVVGQDTSYHAVFDEAFNQIRQSGAVHPAIVLHLLEAIHRLAEHIQLPEQRAALTEHLWLISDAGLGKADAERDRADIIRKRDEALGRLEAIELPAFGLTEPA
ncbi:DUF2254 domain-containing protein [Tianweitania sediminis]|uniref:DUF2254 domain-containing protein n=2 Tax=Tianweitania sediminis TaxID=1502156 RepID=A0A8J7R087_9HYPH|nr:DUF2254 domain-containing protein [Tianweitania sediminis]